MNGKKLSTRDYQIFLYKCFWGLTLAWAGLLLGLAGYFYAWIAWGLTALIGIIMIKLAFQHRVVLRISLEMWIATITFIILAITFAFVSTPTVFSGRDQGAISEAAIRLNQSHSFYFSTPASQEFFKLHEKGRAQNFPGFYYTSTGELVTQFPLAYISWLALFFSLFGVAGFMLANAVLMYFFLMSFYLLLRLFIENISAIPSMLFVGTSFIFMWFSRFTLSENMALPLLWTSLLAMMLIVQYQRLLFYTVFLLSITLLAFTRIEGIAFLIFSFIILFSFHDTRLYIKEKFFKRFLLPILAFLGIFIANAIVDINFYREMVRALLPSVKLPQAQYLGNLKNTPLPDYYTLKLFALYGMLGFFILAAIAIVTYFWKKEFHKLIPFFLILPTFIYLFDSNISPDHPWMLRRFMFSLTPLAIFYSGLLIGEWMEKNSREKYANNFKVAAVGLTLILIFQNFPAFSNFISFVENDGLLEQTKLLSERFSDKDLILIDQKATSDGWSMIAGPMSSLYGKNSVYFFNTQDLNKLDLSRFENIYLISSNDRVGYYMNSTLGKKLSENGDYSFRFSQLNSHKDEPLEEVSFPDKKETHIEGKIFKYAK
ncbi:MAG: hypothetical protein ACD_5C00356G0007 [uncultured bacterium]|nr:MAG: hypothetical protein ACD_5C00356G0007 [uncultured bacterium]